MKIKYKTFKQGSTFGAVLLCEHCKHEEKITSGNTSRKWMEHTLIKWRCGMCKKDKEGTLPVRYFKGSECP